MGVLFGVVKVLYWMFEFTFSKILGFIYGGPSLTIPTAKNSILMESATSLANRIRKKKVTSAEVVQVFIDRIKEINDVLNCVVYERFDEALKEARRVDEFIESGVKTEEELESETPFLGVPFTAKDSIAMKGLIHSAGCWARRNVVAEKDAEVVAIMRKAGAIPLACTNVSELCFTCESNNPIFGRTKNPYNTNRSVGGSSGGEACLIASLGSPFGIGSDLGGSIRVPSAFNGIFGHKPSAGVSPVKGLFPDLKESQLLALTVGPMSKSSADLLPVLKVITKHSKSDLELDKPVDLKKLKYYYMESDGGGLFTSTVDKEIKEAINNAVNHFKNTHGAEVKKVDLKRMKKALFIWMAKINNESGPHLTRTILNNEGKLNVRTELVKKVFGYSQHTLILLLTIWSEEMLHAHHAHEMQSLRKECSELYEEFENFLGSDGVFIYPTQPTAAFYHTESLTKSFNLGYTGIFNALGLPATHCPMGLNSEGLPIGFQVVGGMNQDRLTIAVAREIEKAFGGWKPSPTHGQFTLKQTVFQMAN